MFTLPRTAGRLVFGGLLLVSSLAQAGTPFGATVTVGPLLAEVPTLSDNMLIVLGFLLAVVAFRTLRSQRDAQKVVSILVLVSGVVVGGIGVERSFADNGIFASKGVCTEAGPLGYDPNQLTYLQNDCPGAIEIKGFASTCPLSTVGAGCEQGQVLAPGGSCSYLPLCVPD